MNILFIAPYVPSRIRVRPFHIIEELARRHDVRVVALGGAEKAQAAGVEEILDTARDLRIVPHSNLRGYSQCLAALPTRVPMCAAFSRSRAMKKAISEALASGQVDLVHIEHLRAAHYVPDGVGVPIIFDSVDCLTALFRKMARSRRSPLAKLVMAEEAWKLRRYEPYTLRRFDRVIATCDSEREELLALDTNLRIDVVCNGVDTDYFAPAGGGKHPRRIVFSGKMSYHPNGAAALWFAQSVFPRLKAKWPDAEFVIAGSSPPPAVAKLSRAPGISVTGYVEDMRPHLDSASVAVVPMRIAVGIQNKVLEAMAMGLPVVACADAARPFGRDCPGIVTAQDPDDVFHEVSRLIENPQLTKAIGDDGRKAALQKFSWKSSVDKLESIYEQALLQENRSG